MYTGTNPSALRSRKWIRDALLELLEEKSYESITIKEITERSDLARPTFYQLFNSKAEIIEYHLDILFEAFLKEIKEMEISNTKDLARLYFSFFQSNKKFIKQLIDNELIYILNNKFYDYIKKINITLGDIIGEDLMSPYFFAFVSSGLVGILVYWFQHDDPITVDQLAILLSEILDSKINTFNRKSLSSI